MDRSSADALAAVGERAGESLVVGPIAEPDRGEKDERGRDR